ncbi:MAG: heme lyase CcmF/NrfE family subunit [candidate division KSB1 bacterium]|nr:heme lyase CcmF/NrfE family subunit [candidate division KSB1 bacterium]MDZ7304790.1 heme lyase CcmF/NrfE family subunit [candidate division KSB1 bacterium]MDZ7313864.1 heme lyase CcmF/NrfE family subunit [candidate division KSB1 bacterium]
MPELGTWLLWLAGLTTAYSLVTLIIGIRSGKTGAPWIESGHNAALASGALMTLAAGLLFYNLAISNFRVAYVASYTSRELPLFYKLTAFWGGQQGSLLLWGWLLSLFAVAVLLIYRRRPDSLSVLAEGRSVSILPYVVAILMAILLFFNTLSIFVAPPFELLNRIPANGAGLNPLLQHPAMAAHPPLLYLGYVGMAVPLAFALAALLSGRLDDVWVKNVRRWTLIPWFFLTMGIMLGARWAYVELGWGGYWAWDPVENASLMPWLSGTAFLHSIMIQEKKGMLKIWNMVLIILTFELCIFGTFITRSGIISSVHAFAQSGIGPMFGTFLGTSTAFCLWALLRRVPELRAKNQLESIVSRESTFLLNNLILLGATFAVLWGTIFPLVSEAVRGVKITVGAPFFNQVNLPIALVLLALTGIGPVLAWRRSSPENLRKQFTWPLAVMLTGAVALWIFGVRHLYAVVALSLSLFVTATIVQEFYRGVRARRQSHQENWLVALARLLVRNQRRYGGYVVHFGVVLVFVGISGTAFNSHLEATVRAGESFPIGRYHVQFDRILFGNDAAKQWMAGELNVFNEGKFIKKLQPEKRLYVTHEQPTTEVALLSTWRDDLYLVLAGYEEEKQEATFSAYVNPLVAWLWIGGWVMAIGTLFAMLPLARTRPDAQAASSTKDRQRLRRIHKKSTFAAA